MLSATFFEREAPALARALLGKVLRHRVGERWLSARIVETEAYLLDERASHSSLGRTPSREPMFMAPGTIYMYHSRGGPSMNLSAAGPGNAVLLKAAVPHLDERSPPETLEAMQALNPARGGEARPPHRQCAGQSLLCRSLGLRIADWTGRRFDPERLLLEDVGHRPPAVIQTRRLGIPPGRDEHLLLRFIDAAARASATRDPLRTRGAIAGTDYILHEGG